MSKPKSIEQYLAENGYDPGDFDEGDLAELDRCRDVIRLKHEGRAALKDGRVEEARAKIREAIALASAEARTAGETGEDNQ